MKSSLIVASLILTAFGSAQVKMQVLIGGKRAGTASLLQKILPDGSKMVQLSMELKTEQVNATLRSESTYDKKGNPIRKFQETIVPSQKTRRTVIVTFDAQGANTTIDLNGKRAVKHVALPSTATREDASEFWFSRDQPKVGQVNKAYNFNIESLTWELTVTTYVGIVDATIGGKKVKARRTESSAGAALLDETGLPLRLELSNGALERIW